MINFISRWTLLTAAVWFVFGAGLGSAAADDVQINSYTTGDQETPSVSLDADGNFVVVWSSFGSGGTDSSNRSIQGRRYTSDGLAVGSQFQVNTWTSNAQGGASVSLDADGDFVVAWTSDGTYGTDHDFYSIQGQRYASDGSKVGGQFQVNSYIFAYQYTPEVSLAADGDFVIVWTSMSSGGTDEDPSVQAQRYASDGSALGGELQVNSYTSSDQRSPSVSLDSDGDFVVVWESWGSPGTDHDFYSIQGQRYGSDGSAVGGQFQVNTYTTNRQSGASVSLDVDGDFVVVWTSDGSPGTDSSLDSIQGQRHASDGSTVGGQFQVNTYTTNIQRSASVSLDADGDFVVVWTSRGSPGSDSSYSIQGQRYASDGCMVGGQFQVNTYVTFSQRSPSVSLDAAGRFVVVWGSDGSGGTDSSGDSIQRADPPLFEDGFESGGTSAWSSASP